MFEKFFSHEAPIGIANNQISLNFLQKKHIFEAKSNHMKIVIFRAAAFIGTIGTEANQILIN